MIIGAEARTQDVSEHLRDLRFSTIELRERLDGLERDWLVGRLRATRGVRDIEYRGDDGRRLVVEHDAAELSRFELVDVFYRCGLPARALNPPLQTSQSCYDVLNISCRTKAGVELR